MSAISELTRRRSKVSIPNGVSTPSVDSAPPPLQFKSRNMILLGAPTTNRMTFFRSALGCTLQSNGLAIPISE